MTKVPKRAFDHCAGDYARCRPGYPPELLDHIAEMCAPGRCGLAADVGAGTGIFARLLPARGYRVVAVEPSEVMLKRVSEGTPPNQAGALLRVCAAAEHTALADRSVSLVACAQSFHWFNPPVALAEFGRILRPGGCLVLAWNNRDRLRSEFVADFEALVKKYNPAYDVEYRQQDWPAKIEKSGMFGRVEYRRFDWLWERTREEFIGFTRSVSYIRNVIPRAEIPKFEAGLGNLFARHTAGGRCRIPIRTDCWWALRV